MHYPDSCLTSQFQYYSYCKYIKIHCLILFLQYVLPTDAHLLNAADLLVIDEAAAIPLPLVRAMIGPYLIFLSSTVNGYEGTGRSLSLKLLQQLAKDSKSPPPVSVYFNILAPIK